MRLHKVIRSYGCEINVAPLIDVIFLLIIFFMTVSQISRVEVEKLTLPEAVRGEASGPVRQLTINVHPDGRIIAHGHNQNVTTLRRLLATEKDRTNLGELSVLLRVDRDTPWEKVGPVMNVCAAGGIDRVKIAVLEAEENARVD